MPFPGQAFLGERDRAFLLLAPCSRPLSAAGERPSPQAFCEQGSTFCARFGTFRPGGRHPLCSFQHFPPGVRRSGRPGFWERPSRPRYSSFCGPAPSPAMCSQANVSLRRGPTRATKVQQLLIFGVPPSPSEAGQAGGGLLPTSVKPGGPARFSPDFRVLSQKRGRRGLARVVFRFLRGVPHLLCGFGLLFPSNREHIFSYPCFSMISPT